MRAALYLFVLLMVCKDVLYAPYPYGLRLAAQIGALIAGLYWFSQSVGAGLLRRYWPIWGYLLVISVAAPTTTFPWFVLLQAGSLASVVLFTIGYVERSRADALTGVRAFVTAVIVAYAVVCTISLLLLKIQPGLVYGSLFVGGSVGEEHRFHGLMAKSSMIGAAAGLLLGFAVLRIRSMAWKVSLGGVAATCVVLTQSRSFWGAAVLAGGLTLWVYYPWWRTRVIAGSMVLATVVAAVVTSGTATIKVDGIADFARLDTLTTLTGRTELWADALDSIAQRPLLGYGFTLGSSGLSANRSSNDWTNAAGVAPTELSRQTLHNGYLQSLMDAGVLGFFFYIATIVTALLRLVSVDRTRQYPELLYCLVFLAVANVGESVIYSGSVFHSLCFWMCAILSMGLLPSASVAAVPYAAVPTRGNGGDTAFPNLMR